MEQPVNVSPSSLMNNDNMDNMSNMSPSPFFKVEDYSAPNAHSLSVTKPVKKRKSWGQELPEPKTALPPRKRAKTDDEKEQRRIERIKRNRAAAHNSRERKRVEAESLAMDNDKLRQIIVALQQNVKVRDAKLAKVRELYGSVPEVSIEDSPYDTSNPSPSSSSYTIDPRASLASSTPATTPDRDMAYIKMEEPASFVMPPPAHLEAEAGALDLTQHSAAMLCDLQCQSSTPNSLQQSLQSTLQAWSWTRLMLALMHTSIMTTYKSLLLAFWTLSPTRMTQLLTTLRPSLTSTLPRWTSPLPATLTLLLWQATCAHSLASSLPMPASSALALMGQNAVNERKDLVVSPRSQRRLVEHVKSHGDHNDGGCEHGTGRRQKG